MRKFIFSLMILCFSAPLTATPPHVMSHSFKGTYDQLIAALSAETMKDQARFVDQILARDAKLTENGVEISRQEWLDRLSEKYAYNARMVLEDVYWSGGDRIIVVQKAEPLEQPSSGPCCPSESSFVTTFIVENSKITSVETSGRLYWTVGRDIDG